MRFWNNLILALSQKIENTNKHTKSVRLKKPGPKHDGRNWLRSSMTEREEHFELIPFIT